MEQTANKSGLQGAVETALAKGTEKERIIAILDCIRGYKNEFNQATEKAQCDGFMKCKNEYRNQISKVKDFVNNNSDIK